MERGWGGLLIDFFRPAVFRQFMGWSLYIIAFGLVFAVRSPIYVKFLALPFLFYLLNARPSRWNLAGKLLQILLFNGCLLLLAHDLVFPAVLPVLALSAYALVPFKVVGILSGVELSAVALSEAWKWKAVNQMGFLGLGCFLVIIPHFLGARDVVTGTLAVVLFVSAFTIYLEKIQKNLILADFLSHFLLMAYFMVPAILALIFSYYV